MSPFSSHHKMFAVFYEYVGGDSEWSHMFLGVASSKAHAQSMVESYHARRNIHSFNIEYRPCNTGMVYGNNYSLFTYVVSEIKMNTLVI